MADPNGGGVSRRHVIAGVAWSAPAIVIATALPARAVSGSVPGAIALVGVAASMVESVFRVTGQLTYVGNGDDIEDMPVGDIVMKVSLPTNRLAIGFAAQAGPGWGLFRVETDPGNALNTLYHFSLIGGTLTATNPFTPPLDATIAKFDTNLDPVEVTVRGDGYSQGDDFTPGGDVPFVTQTLPIAVGTNLTLAVGVSAIRYQQTEGFEQFIYAFDGTTRWAGPYWPIGAEATGIKVTARIPQTNASNDLVEQFRGDGWSTPIGPVAVDGMWEVVYTYSIPLTSSFQTTSTLQFALKSLAPAANIATLRTEGVAAGCKAYEERPGPQSLDYANSNWDPAMRHQQGGWDNRPVGEGAGG